MSLRYFDKLSTQGEGRGSAAVRYPPAAIGSARIISRPQVGAAALPPAGRMPAKPALFLIVGRHEIDGWKVAVMQDGYPPDLLAPDQAIALGEQLIATGTAASIKLGQELIEMAAICNGRWGE